MKRKYLVLLVLSIISFSVVNAQRTNTPNNFFIIPEQSSGGEVIKAVQEVGQGTGGTVWDRYNAQSDTLRGNLGDQFASGIMTWDTIVLYAIYLVRFMSQVALVIGAIMIIYAGYIYATAIFTGSGDGTTKGNTAIKYAIIGVVVVTSSYAIMRILTSAFLS